MGFYYISRYYGIILLEEILGDVQYPYTLVSFVELCVSSSAVKSSKTAIERRIGPSIRFRRWEGKSLTIDSFVNMAVIWEERHKTYGCKSEATVSYLYQLRIFPVELGRLDHYHQNIFRCE